MISPILAGIFAVAYFAITIWLCRGVKLDARAISYAAITIALTVALSFVYIPLPTGATISAGSWIPLMVLAVIYDYRLAMVAGWVCGVVLMLVNPLWAPVHWAQIFIEQLVCFSCLGYAGVFGTDKRWKLACGLALAVAIKFMGHVISGVIFFSQNAWDGWGAWGYSLAYHISSKVPEGIVSALIVLALPVKQLQKAVRGGKG